VLGYHGQDPGFHPQHYKMKIKFWKFVQASSFLSLVSSLGLIFSHFIISHLDDCTSILTGVFVLDWISSIP
jgi:hypothetical protein